MKCFHKLWLESTINTLYDNGLQDNMLNILYNKNKNANVAIKFNNKMTRRTDIHNIVMQATLFSSFMCASQMEQINNIVQENEELKYRYQNDKDITIGFLNYIDDQLGISECKDSSIKNAALIYFAETRCQMLSEDKSC